ARRPSMKLPPGLRGQAGVARRRALSRAGLALLGAVVLALGLLMLGERQPRPAVDPGALPVAERADAVPVPIPEPAPMAVADIAGTPAANLGAGDTQATVALPAPAVEAERSGPEPAAGVMLPLAALQPGGEGIYLQLGVFGDAANALALYDRLAAAGMPARIQSRVVLGPFADRRGAERAQAELRRAGAPEGILVPPRPR
ncbi:SPOR domain-containing protein, partial [Arthrospira platensis SPKY1]|nr:SPOR domain-containing protein [Arthrospira platensis SPKY1]